MDRWAAVIRSADGTVRIEEVSAFLERTRLAGDTPSRQLEDISEAQAAIPVAVDQFQTHLVELRKAREAEIQRDLDAVLDRLSALASRFRAQLTLDLGDVPDTDEGLSPVEKRRQTIAANGNKRSKSCSRIGQTGSSGPGKWWPTRTRMSTSKLCL